MEGCSAVKKKQRSEECELSELMIQGTGEFVYQMIKEAESKILDNQVPNMLVIALNSAEIRARRRYIVRKPLLCAPTLPAVD